MLKGILCAEAKSNVFCFCSHVMFCPLGHQEMCVCVFVFCFKCGKCYQVFLVWYLKFQHSNWAVKCKPVVIEYVIKQGKIFLLSWQGKIQGEFWKGKENRFVNRCGQTVLKLCFVCGSIRKISTVHICICRALVCTYLKAKFIPMQDL